jgi:transcriptional regulator with XRE-family HTH domain
MTVGYAKSVMNVRKMMSDLNPEYLHVVAVLKRARLIAGHTLEDVERISNGKFTKEAVGSYERNSRNITVKKLLELLEVYGISISRLLDNAMWEQETQRRRHELRTTA